MYNFWDTERVKKKEEEIRKKNLRVVGSQVDSFFIDKMQELKYEERTGQWEMAVEIVQSMVDNKHILVEAGVGIGKTFAYVVPLLYYHQKYKKPVIIATSTIALQEQLADDIRTIEKILNYYPEIFIAKGQSHFLCKKRFENYFLEKRNTKEYEYYEEIDKGGYEKSDWNIEIPEKIWKKINVLNFNPVKCRQECSFKENCFYNQLRIKLQKTKGFILCNQDLLAMNMKKRKNNNNELFASGYEYIVIDEVHNLESKIRNSFTMSVTYVECKRILEELIKNNKIMGSILDNKINDCFNLINKVFNALPIKNKTNDIEQVKLFYSKIVKDIKSE